MKRKLVNYFIGEPDEVGLSDEVWFFGFYAILIGVPSIVFLIALF